MNEFSSSTRMFIFLGFIMPLYMDKIKPESNFYWLIKYDLHWFLPLISIGLIAYGSYKNYQAVKIKKAENLMKLEQQLNQAELEMRDQNDL